jgi:hypothetical protein
MKAVKSEHLDVSRFFNRRSTTEQSAERTVTGQTCRPTAAINFFADFIGRKTVLRQYYSSTIEVTQ